VNLDTQQAQVEQWDIFEVALQGPRDGNPYVDVRLTAEFRYNHRVLRPEGFYDGDGTYRIRLMPDKPGKWAYITHSNVTELDAVQGEFECMPASSGNHGPVGVHNQMHFAYADGAPYYPFGTTCYAWVHQGDAMEEQTLATLAAAPFNKMRMCVFPKDYIYNANEPVYYPYERSADGTQDLTRFDPAFWQHFERRVGELRNLGIEADIIVFHPYDRWGYARMSEAEDDHYLHYLVARLAAFRNVWWSLANEYDFLLDVKPMARWDHSFQLIQEMDPYHHLRSVHNGDTRMNYDHTKPWVTHVCIQNFDVNQVRQWRKLYHKPIVNDECQYEGNIPLPWGNISAQELVHRFWVMVINGGYAGHGETYLHPEDLLWWSKGGILRGESAPRIGFLRSIVEELPPGGLQPMGDMWPWMVVAGAGVGDTRIFYFGENRPAAWTFGLPTGVPFTVEMIDTWNMTVERIPGTFQDVAEIPAPDKPYCAVRLRTLAE
jgi:hypothetical protein